jgi:hypothetical protein
LRKLVVRLSSNVMPRWVGFSSATSLRRNVANPCTAFTGRPSGVRTLGGTEKYARKM